MRLISMCTYYPDVTVWHSLSLSPSLPSSLSLSLSDAIYGIVTEVRYYFQFHCFHNKAVSV